MLLNGYGDRPKASTHRSCNNKPRELQPKAEPRVKVGFLTNQSQLQFESCCLTCQKKNAALKVSRAETSASVEWLGKS